MIRSSCAPESRSLVKTKGKVPRAPHQVCQFDELSKFQGRNSLRQLLEHPAVAECAVVASPDPERTNIVKAFIVPRPGAETGEALTAELQDFVKNGIAPYKYPRAVEYIDELPKTQTGKVQRFVLRQREREKG